MVALRESGYNAVGLGSAVLMPEHFDKLGQEVLFCGDMDNFGMFYRQEQTESIKYCFFAPEGKDPYDAFLKNGYVKIVKISD